MFDMSVKTESKFSRVKREADDATYRNIRHAAFSISKKAKKSIKKRRTPSAPGSPPTTRGRGGKNYRAAIYVAASKESALIGPRASVIGDVGEAHEFGKTRMGTEFPERAAMGPALEESLDRFAADWKGSVGS